MRLGYKATVSSGYLLHLVGERAVAVRGQAEQRLLHAARELLDVLVAERAQLEQLRHLRRVLHRQPQLAQVAAELLHALVVALDGVRRELRQLARDALRLRHLPRPAARTRTQRGSNYLYCILYHIVKHFEVQ